MTVSPPEDEEHLYPNPRDNETYVLVIQGEINNKIEMSRRKVTTFNNVNYERISSDSTEDFLDSQFAQPTPTVPWKAICLATLLCVGGLTVLIVGSLLVSGQIDTKYADRTWPLIILGMIMFLPGAYHIRIAYYAYCQYPGYSFDDIPEFD